MKNILLLIAFGLLMSSCARQISSDTYSAQQVGEAALTYSGRIKNIREVLVQNGEQLEDNHLGIAGGGIAGGALGSCIGRGNFFPTAAGAVAGAVAGSFAEKKLKEQTGFEYVVELDNGQLMTVVQGKDHIFSVGQPVYVFVSPAGRSRIVAQ